MVEYRENGALQVLDKVKLEWIKEDRANITVGIEPSCNSRGEYAISTTGDRSRSLGDLA